jgi:serine/threonine protein kinase
VQSQSPRFKEITPSEFPWEREAIAFLREGLPDTDPCRLWTNFEFIADDGSVNEVDALVLTSKGFYLVEIKGRPGSVKGDGATWTWAHDGRTFTVDNPLLLANRKAKKLASLLKRQTAARNVRLPFLEAKVFLSAEGLECRMDPPLRLNVHLRTSILEKLTRWEAGDEPRMRIDRPLAEALTLAVDQAGIRRSQKARKVGDYRLEGLLFEGPGYQDWEARHVALEKAVRRVRIYNVPPAGGAVSRETIQRAAKREFQILEGIAHAGILKAEGYTEHSLGPALVFEHEPGSIRLDHYLKERSQAMAVDQRLDFLRQIGEAVQYAHEKKLVHRALCPQSVLVRKPRSNRPVLQVFNWQTGARGAGSQTSGQSSISGTLHVDQLIESPAAVYLAPEALLERGSTSEAMDVFSLGAIAYHLFSGQAPAATFYKMMDRIREEKGLKLSSVLDGAGEELQFLVQASTAPEVTERFSSVKDFLEGLDEVEAELTRPDTDEGFVPDPSQATKGDRLDHGLLVEKRLGKGATAVGLLVSRGDGRHVLKVALTPEHNERLEAEAEVLRALRHQFIVELHEVLRYEDRVGLLMAFATEGTLAERLREEGRLHLELLERFGEDLLQAVEWLDQQGIPHRDIKPENVGVSKVGKSSTLHLVLFDFSLARTPAENLSAGTPPYLDPFLHRRKRWDSHAERYAAAVTLYQMASGALPAWGDGQSHPAVLECEVTLEPNLFDPALREPMASFFEKALRRDYRERFDNASDMLQAWRDVFRQERLRASPPPMDAESEAPDLEHVTLDTQLAILSLSTRALNALERWNAVTVRDLLGKVPLPELLRMRGVGNKTRREISRFIREVQARFPNVEPTRAKEPSSASMVAPARATVRELAALLLPAKPPRREQAGQAILRRLLGLDAEGRPPWLTQSDLAREHKLTRARIGQVLTQARKRWARIPALSEVREEIVSVLAAHGQIATVEELADALVSRRGEELEGGVLLRESFAVVRAALETESEIAEPRYLLRRPRDGHVVLVVRDDPETGGLDGAKLADYALRLGEEADLLARAEPLPSPARVQEELGRIRLPSGLAPLATNRLLSIATRCSREAALSSRLELYPKGMSAEKALRLAQGALAGAKELTPAQIRERVSGRYPDAEPLPGRPGLDRLLKETGSDLEWKPSAREGEGAYAPPHIPSFTISSRTSYGAALPPSPRFEELSPEETDLHLFDERLKHAVENGAFLALTVSPKALARVEKRLQETYPVEPRSLDALLLHHMHDVVEEKKADWSVVVRADAASKDGGDWANLLRVVRLALPRVRAELASAARTVLLTNPGLLARYDQLSFLDELRDQTGRPGGPPGLWVLVPADGQEEKPVIDGKPVPVYSRGQWKRIPEAWAAR